MRVRNSTHVSVTNNRAAAPLARGRGGTQGWTVTIMLDRVRTTCVVLLCKRTGPPCVLTCFVRSPLLGMRGASDVDVDNSSKSPEHRNASAVTAASRPPATYRRQSFNAAARFIPRRYGGRYKSPAVTLRGAADLRSDVPIGRIAE